MLIQFRFENYRSFKESSTISLLVAENGDDKSTATSRNTTEVAGLHLVRSAAIYGANASGKSNVVKALKFMANFVVNSSREGQSQDKIDTQPYLLSPKYDSKPSSFEVIFLIKNVKYRYGFEADSDKIVSEWLYHVPRSRESYLFERTYDDYKISRSFQQYSNIKQRTRDNALFLSVLSQFNVGLAEKIVEWFRSIYFVGADPETTDVNRMKKVMLQDEARNAVSIFLNGLDIGITSMKAEERPWDQNPTFALLPPETRNALRLQPIVDVKTVHKVYENDLEVGEVDFDLTKNESDGTKKLFGLIEPLIVILAKGGTVVIDELDARLHPKITETLIEYFNHGSFGSDCAQLIFTTHDTNLLRKEIFRRDQIWFVEKNRFGSSSLYSLIEYMPRKDASFSKDYMAGRYGAVPFINMNIIEEHLNGVVNGEN